MSSKDGEPSSAQAHTRPATARLRELLASHDVEETKGQKPETDAPAQPVHLATILLVALMKTPSAVSEGHEGRAEEAKPDDGLHAAEREARGDDNGEEQEHPTAVLTPGHPEGQRAKRWASSTALNFPAALPN